MATNLALDPALVDEAVAIGGHKTKKAAVTAALEEYVEFFRKKEERRRSEQLRILELEGQLEWNPEYDYKAGRRLDGRATDDDSPPSRAGQ